MKPFPLLTDFQKIWILSKANGGFYVDDDLPRNPIRWPRGWLTKRLEEIREGKEDNQ